MYGCVGQVCVEDDGVFGSSAVDAATELSRVGENCPSLVPDGRLASLPFLGEESLPFEVLVELVLHVDGDVAEDVFYDFLDVFGHYSLSLQEKILCI